MPEKYQNKFRISSSRLKNWDYGNNGAYFITICTKNREHFFGEILNGVMHLNESGKMVEQFWAEIPNHFPFIELGNYVVMSNHVHGILMIDKNRDGGMGAPVETRLIASLPTPTNAATPPTTNPPGGITGDKNPMFHENISRIMRWFKGRCTFDIRKMNPGFAWQTRFHDHIIRDAASFERIQYYIANNPHNWKDDNFY